MKRLRQALIEGREVFSPAYREAEAASRQVKRKTNGIDMEKLRLLAEATSANIDRALYELRNELKRLNGHVLENVDYPVGVGMVDWRQVYGPIEVPPLPSESSDDSFSDSLES